MLNEATLDVLARAAEIGLPEAAGVGASVYDPFLRPIIRKNVKRAVAEASSEAAAARGDHVLRLAFLRAHPGAPHGLDPNDVRAVAEAFEALAAPYLPPRTAAAGPRPQGGAYRVAAGATEGEELAAPPRPKRKPWPVTLAVLGMLTLATLVSVALLAAPYVLPTPLEKFTRTPFGHALGEPLTDAVVAGGRRGSPERRSETRAAVLAPGVEKQIGGAAFGELDRLLDAIPDAAGSNADDTDAALRPLIAHLNALDDHLAGAHVPALLHAYATGTSGKRSVWVTSYFVEERTAIAVDERFFRVARGRRLDELNLVESMLYKGDLETWAILSLDRIDEQLVEILLTPLVKGTPMGPEEWRDTDDDPRAELARTASKLVVFELMAFAKIGPADAEPLRSAIERRNDAMVSMNKMGLDVEATSRIRLSPSLVRSLEKMSGSTFEKKLAGEVLHLDRRMKVYERPLAPIAAELARIQEEEFALLLAALETKETSPGGGEEDGVTMSRRDALLASRLAILAHAQPCPRLALWLDIRRATDEHTGWDERLATQSALDQLAKELGIAREPEEDAVLARARRAKSLLETPPEVLREAASKVHDRTFGRPAPKVIRKAL